jgi:hypothetical protein
MLVLVITSFLMVQPRGRDAVLAARIHESLHIVLTTGDAKQEEAAEAEAKEIFTKRGLPVIAAVGDEAAYEFVLLTCSAGPTEFQNQVLRRAVEGAKRREIPADAASYCAAHLRQERVKARQRSELRPILHCVNRLSCCSRPIRRSGKRTDSTGENVAGGSRARGCA